MEQLTDIMINAFIGVSILVWVYVIVDHILDAAERRKMEADERKRAIEQDQLWRLR